MQNEIKAAAEKIYAQIKNETISEQVESIIKAELEKPAYKATEQEIQGVIEMAVDGGFAEAETLLGV